MSFNFGSSDSEKTSSSQTDPWAPAKPYLTDFLAKVGAQGNNYGATPNQQTAFSTLKANAANGNPWATKIAGLTDQAFAAPDRSAAAGDALTTLKSHLGGVANGQNLDPMANPDFAKLVNQTGTDAQNRINAQFAGAGRDLSGINQQSVARGVTQAELPILTDQYNRERAAQADAAKTIAGAGQSTATTQGQLDANRQGLQTQGVNLAGQALGAQNYGANQTLNLDQQQKQLPLQDLGLLAQLLYPAAGFGSSTQGQAQGSSTSAGFGLSLSDERAKEDIAEVGEMADGTTIYKWRYKGDPTFHTGPMAQEVEKKTPGAVVDDPDTGLKHVNLDAATRKAAEIVRKRKEKR